MSKILKIEPTYRPVELALISAIDNAIGDIAADKMTIAYAFSKKTFRKAVNIHVVGADFAPVEGYEDKLIKNS